MATTMMRGIKLLQEAIYFALAKTNNTQIKLKEEQKESEM
jgi:hypothetical protein